MRTAHKAVERIMLEGGPQMRPYRCEYGAIHLTSKPKKAYRFDAALCQQAMDECSGTYRPQEGGRDNGLHEPVLHKNPDPRCRHSAGRIRTANHDHRSR